MRGRSVGSHLGEPRLIGGFVGWSLGCVSVRRHACGNGDRGLVSSRSSGAMRKDVLHMKYTSEVERIRPMEGT